ncbi:potassium channel protein [Paracoccus liaowanqingii]|uniref:Potassium channel protein n=1 Tax=Paracoccus liaowanqingii TaxID=2560053 RepID=A0A4P7HJM8_9RHOB|nr:ion transporter [Paracoccus liaowanqingii]QBX34334.1 potassium channel protein [Paracoccus liaowanqingii]
MEEVPEPHLDPSDDEQERWHVLTQLEEWLERPMLVLSFIWLSLVTIELIWTTSGVFEMLGTIIWIVFILEFLLRFTLAPRKIPFLRRNPITIIALAAPAFRFLRVLRLLRLTRGLRLVRIVGTANRGLGALRKSFDRRGLGYVLTTTALVILLGAGGMLAFEPASDVQGGFTSYPDALWWTAMLVSTMGSAFWPLTAEGRVLALLLTTYGLAVFGYITASFATFFIGQEAAAPDGDVGGSQEIAALREDIAALRIELQRAEKG